MTDKEELLYKDDSVEIETYKCPNCGGDAVFNPEKQLMQCLYCGSFFELPKDNKKVEENLLSELLKNGKVWDNVEVYQCSSCGAKQIIENQEVSHVCAFCGTRNIVKVDNLPGIKPHGVIPFKFDKFKTAEIANKWVKKKLYAPKSFKKSAKPEKIYGIYNPVFTFDAFTYNSYVGKLGKKYTVTKRMNGKIYTDVEIRYFNIKGMQDVNFDDVLVQASSTIPSYIIKSIEPFSTNQAKTYKEEFLRGFGATTYNKSGEECWNECKSIMSARIENYILKRYDYDVKLFLNINTRYSSEKFKLILVPIYVGHYRYNKKLYNFYVNGENGRIAGKTPISALKVSFTVLIILLLIGGFVLISLLT